MLKECVTIVIIVLEELRNPGFVVMRNYMLVIIKLIWNRRTLPELLYQ